MGNGERVSGPQASHGSDGVYRDDVRTHEWAAIFVQITLLKLNLIMCYGNSTDVN